MKCRVALSAAVEKMRALGDMSPALLEAHAQIQIEFERLFRVPEWDGSRAGNGDK
jgi:hypothetical protein